jgi:hypothetical protein
MKALFALILATALLCGCSSTNKNLIVTTSTIIGLEVAENPQTGLYQARLGYGRAEFALAPTATNGVTPDVIMELRYHGLISTQGGIYQRLAIGQTACSQMPAALMFGKNSTGDYPTNSLISLLPSVIPELNKLRSGTNR